jgi:hypothetical protein
MDFKTFVQKMAQAKARTWPCVFQVRSAAEEASGMEKAPSVSRR